MYLQYVCSVYIYSPPLTRLLSVGQQFRVLQSIIKVEEVSCTLRPSSSFLLEYFPILGDGRVAGLEVTEVLSTAALAVALVAAAGALAVVVEVVVATFEVTESGNEKPSVWALNSLPTLSNDMASAFILRIIKCQRFLIVLSEKRKTIVTVCIVYLNNCYYYYHYYYTCVARVCVWLSVSMFSSFFCR